MTYILAILVLAQPGCANGRCRLPPEALANMPADYVQPGAPFANGLMPIGGGAPDASPVVPKGTKIERLRSEIESLRVLVESVTIAEIEVMDADEKADYFAKKRKLRWKERDLETAERMAVIWERKRQMALAESVARKYRLAQRRSRGVYWPAGANMARLQRQVQAASTYRLLYGTRYGY